MKILQIFATYLQYGGEEGSVHRIAASLRKEHTVDGFYCSTKEMLSGGPIGKVLVPLNAFRNEAVIQRLRDLQAANSYDFWLIHNVFPAISPAAYDLASELGVPIVHYLHNYRFGCVNGFLFTKGADCRKCLQGNFLHGALGKCWRNSYTQSSVMAALIADTRRKDLFGRVAKWIAISQAQKDLHVQMGIPEDRIEVIHHFYTPKQIPAQLTSKDPGYALFIGRLSPEKGVDRLIDAWALLPKNRQLVIAGDGSILQSLKNRAASLGLGNIRFVGFVDPDAQKELWDGAAFSVVPSLWQEPFGMVVLEAWARMRPVVAHRIGAMPELITDGENGFLSGIEHPGDLAQSLERAFQAMDDLPKMGRKGYDRLNSNFNEDRWLARISRVFASL